MALHNQGCPDDEASADEDEACISLASRSKTRTVPVASVYTSDSQLVMWQEKCKETSFCHKLSVLLVRPRPPPPWPPCAQSCRTAQASDSQLHSQPAALRLLRKCGAYDTFVRAAASDVDAWDDPQFSPSCPSTPTISPA